MDFRAGDQIVQAGWLSGSKVASTPAAHDKRIVPSLRIALYIHP